MKKLYFLVALLLIFLSNSLNAQVLTELPFGIVIGQTKNSEIEDRGVCEKQIKVRENVFRCEEFDMAGKFIVYSSQNEVVNKVSFWWSLGNLPRKWQELGLYLDSNPEVDVKGTQLDEFLRIIESQGAKYVKQEESYFSSSKSTLITEVTFDIGNYHYDCTFWPSGRRQDGLHHIIITESY